MRSSPRLVGWFAHHCFWASHNLTEAARLFHDLAGTLSSLTWWSLQADSWAQCGFQNETFKYFFKMGISFKWTREQSQGERRLWFLPGPHRSLSLNSSTGKHFQKQNDSPVRKAVVVGNWRCHIFGSEPTQFSVRHGLSESRVDQPGCV